MTSTGPSPQVTASSWAEFRLSFQFAGLTEANTCSQYMRQAPVGRDDLVYASSGREEAMSSPPVFQLGDALLVVDPQNDFCPGGSLGVAEGDLVMPILSDWAAAADRDGVPIF